MKRLKLLFLVSILTLSILNAQDTNQKPGEEPYPAPRDFTDVSIDESLFIAQFDDRNIGTLHLYAEKGNAVSEDYPYKGKPIDATLKGFLPRTIRPYVNTENSKPHANFALRAGDREFYVIRNYDKWSASNLALYVMKNDQLKKVKDLAYVKCKESGCKQVDTWIRDINGDTRLDLIQKTKWSRTPNGKTRVKTVVYTITDRGGVRKMKNPRINKDDYKMEEL